MRLLSGADQLVRGQWQPGASHNFMPARRALARLGLLRTLASASTMAKPSTSSAAAVNIVRGAAWDVSASNVQQRLPKDAEWVLIGEASHGTKEFYETRANITKELIEKQGFNAVAAEADFPDAFRANLWVRKLSEDKSVDEALSDFKRFPIWMCRNKTVADFLQWLRAHNAALPEEQQGAKGVGFYGLDVYSLHSSTEAVIRYLERVDPEAAAIARNRYACFDRFGADAQLYGLALRYGHQSCEREAIRELLHLRRVAAQQRPKVKGRVAEEEENFAATVNAAVVKDAEQYYRQMYFKDEITWNIRDRHMVDTAEHLRSHLRSRGIENPKIVIWAHNSHVGDARATDMGKLRGEVNVGQLVRERFAANNPDRVVNIGFSTHSGTVAAADNWDEPVKLKHVNPSMPESYENLMHRAGRKAFGLDLRQAARDKSTLVEALAGPKLERAIGVIYAPATERWSHYFSAWLPDQFDMMLHIDETSAVQLLDPPDSWKPPAEEPEPPETFPFAV